MKSWLLLIIGSFCFLQCLVNGAKILGIFPMPAPSHYILGSTLMKALAEKGHQVTLISPFPLKKPMKNFRDVNADVRIEQKEKKGEMFKMEQMNPFVQMHNVYMLGLNVVDQTLSHPSVKKLLDPGEEFDLIIIEQFMTEPLFAYSEHFNCPVVVLSTIASTVLVNKFVGNPEPYSYVPLLFLNLKDKMSFLERVQNTLVNVAIQLYENFYYNRKQNEIAQKHFGNVTDTSELMYKKVALVLVNSHVSVNPPAPRMPNMIDIGGYHVQKPKPFPKDLEDYLNKSKHGVVYFSMGSNIRSADFPDETRNGILRAFSKLKHDVLWKFEDENLPNKPANLKISKWLPQNDLLAHPNVKLFITHGGLLSTIETIYHGVPFVGIPIFGDQKSNVASAVNGGYGESVPFQTLGEKTLSEAINKVLGNPKYVENVKRRSSLMKDRPIPPLDLAVFWIEHVLRQNGGDHLRAAVMDLKLYQYLLLDVIAFLVTVITVPLYLIFVLFKKLRKGTEGIKKKRE